MSCGHSLSELQFTISNFNSWLLPSVGLPLLLVLLIFFYILPFFFYLLSFYRWKQLAYVTLFYFIFAFLLALMGVHWIGSLDRFCVFTDEFGNRWACQHDHYTCTNTYMYLPQSDILKTDWNAACQTACFCFLTACFVLSFMCFTSSLAIPVTHCFEDGHRCGFNSSVSNISCGTFPMQGRTQLDFNYRNKVYYGQFSVIGEYYPPSCTFAVDNSL